MHRYLFVITIFLFSCSKSINKSTVTSVDEQKAENSEILDFIFNFKSEIRSKALIK